MSTDYTPIGPVPSGIANGTVDATSIQLARDMRGKAYGKDVRETIARMTEWHSIRTSASEVLAAQSAADAKKSAQEVTQNAQSALKLFNDSIRLQTQKIDNMVVDFTDYDFDSAPEIVAARRGKASLGAKIDDVEAQVAQKANQAEVRRSTDLSPIDVDEMNTRTKQLFTGGSVAVVGENAVGNENLKNQSVSIEKLENYKIRRNLFDVSKIAINLLVNSKYGNLDPATGYATSDFIQVEPNQDYFLSYSSKMAWYGDDKTFISGVENSNTNSQGIAVTSPPNAVYVRFGLQPSANWQKVMFSKGSSAQPFEPIRKTVKGFEQDRLIDVTSGTETVVYGTNGRIEQINTIKSDREVVTTLSYDSIGKLTSVSEASEGLKKTTTLIYENGKITGTTNTVDVMEGV